MIPMSYQVTLALYCMVTCWRQGHSIQTHLQKLNQVRKDYQQIVSSANLDYTIYRYSRLLALQHTNFILMSIGAGIGVGCVTWVRWRLANFSKDIMTLPSLGINLLDQFQYFAIYSYFVICILQDYLPPAK